jgi:hypothetical protein
MKKGIDIILEIIYGIKMKRIILIVFLVIGLNSCSKDYDSNLLGTWTGFNHYDGIKELIFTKDTITINEYKFGGNPDSKIIWDYTIIDDIIFIKDNNDEVYYYSFPFFSYLVKDNKLFLTGEYYEIYTKKKSRNLMDIKKELNGRWLYSENNNNIEFIFSDNKLNIIEYNVNGNIENNTTFEINDNYLILENTGNILNGIYLHNKYFLYFIGKDVLYLFQGSVGELSKIMIYLKKLK